MGAFTTRLDLSKAAVLVIDDSQHAMEITSQIFLGFGVRQVRKVASAEEAHTLADCKVFDLMLVDTELPGESGLDFIRRIRRHGTNRSSAVIAVSGYTPRSMVEQARDSGANAVLSKPLIPGLLLDRIVWMARATRQFVSSDGYCGPDRRHRSDPLPPGQEERRIEAGGMRGRPDRALSQNDINAMFD